MSSSEIHSERLTARDILHQLQRTRCADRYRIAPEIRGPVLDDLRWIASKHEEKDSLSDVEFGLAHGQREAYRNFAFMLLFRSGMSADDAEAAIEEVLPSLPGYPR